MRHPWLARAGLLLASTAIALLGADLLVGWIDPFGTSHFSNKAAFAQACLRTTTDESGLEIDELVPGSEVRAGVHYRINALGFRGREVAPVKPEGAWRLLVIGDSVAFGWGVEQQDRFPDLVERALAARHPGRAIEVLALATPGHDVLQQWHVYRTRALELQPDAIVFAFNQNDVQRPRDVVDLSLSYKRWKKDAGWWAHVLTLGPSGRVLARVLPHLRDLAVYRYVTDTLRESERDLREAYLRLADGAALCLELYRRALADARRLGIAFAVLDLHDVPAIRTGCAEAGIPYASVAYPGALSDLSLVNSPADTHPNARGHARLAGAALAALAALGVVPDAPPAAPRG